MSFDIPGPVDGITRFGILLRNATAHRAVFFAGNAQYPVQFMAEDIGPKAYNISPAYAAFDLMGTTPLSGSTPPEETGRTYTSTYASSWTRSWRGSGIVSDYLHHGYYGGYQRYSMVGFGGTLATDMAGATIVKAEVYLDNASWWGSTGEALIGVATDTTAPATMPISGATVASPNWPQGAGRWVDITSLWTPAMRAIKLGVGAGTGTGRYGKFATDGVKLRLSYTK